MTPNDVLRKLRYALNIPDPSMIEIFRHADRNVELSELKDLLKKEDEDGFVACTDKVLGVFSGRVHYSQERQKRKRSGAGEAAGPAL